MTRSGSDYSTKVGTVARVYPSQADAARYVGASCCIDQFLTCVLREKLNLGELWDIVRPFRIYEKGE